MRNSLPVFFPITLQPVFNYNLSYNMKRNILSLMLFAFCSTSMWAQWGRPVDYAAGPGLKDAYKDYFTIGVAVNKTNVSDPAQMEIIK